MLKKLRDIFYQNFYVLGYIIVIQLFDIVFNRFLGKCEGIAHKGKD